MDPFNHTILQKRVIFIYTHLIIVSSFITCSVIFIVNRLLYIYVPVVHKTVMKPLIVLLTPSVALMNINVG
jgi:hypothetical protein